MKLSMRTRYGIRALLELAMSRQNVPLRLKSIGRRQGISVKYLEQLFSILKTAGFVRSVRGSKGGYLLAKPADEIKLSDCLIVLEGPVITAECVQDEGVCNRAAECVTRRLWAGVRQAMIDVLAGTTLKQLVDEAGSSQALNYEI